MLLPRRAQTVIHIVNRVLLPDAEKFWHATARR
jgi:hypothetical protein